MYSAVHVCSETTTVAAFDQHGRGQIGDKALRALFTRLTTRPWSRYRTVLYAYTLYEIFEVAWSRHTETEVKTDARRSTHTHVYRKTF